MPDEDNPAPIDKRLLGHEVDDHPDIPSRLQRRESIVGIVAGTGALSIRAIRSAISSTAGHDHHEAALDEPVALFHEGIGLSGAIMPRQGAVVDHHQWKRARTFGLVQHGGEIPRRLARRSRVGDLQVVQTPGPQTGDRYPRRKAGDRSMITRAPGALSR